MARKKYGASKRPPYHRIISADIERAVPSEHSTHGPTLAHSPVWAVMAVWVWLGLLYVFAGVLHARDAVLVVTGGLSFLLLFGGTVRFLSIVH